MKSFYTDTQELAPRLEPPGVDYLVAGQVLVRYGDLRLVWRPGRVCFSGGRGTYCRAELQVLTPVPGWGVMGKSVFSGRYSKKKVKEHVNNIRRLLKLDDLKPEQIDKKRTLVIET